MLALTVGPSAGGAIIAGMEKPGFVLASASPRRRRLLALLGLPYDSIATDTDEDLGSPLRIVPPVLARSLAAEKARAAAAQAPDAACVLAFDTIVVLDRQVLGKPADRPDARRMLDSLSGRAHEVITGVAVQRAGDADPTTFAVMTPVDMRDLDTGTVEEWLEGDEVLGCAGAYNIERHLASVGEGQCYQNVAGLPLCHVYERLRRMGIDAVEAPVTACEQALGRACSLGRTVCGRSR
jgi:septum formation protein